jgi:hypothetical protein
LRGVLAHKVFTSVESIVMFLTCIKNFFRSRLSQNTYGMHFDHRWYFERR